MGRPITAAQSEISRIRRDGAIPPGTWIVCVKLVELFAAGGAQHEIGYLRVGLKKIEPRFTKCIGTSNLEREGEAGVIVIRMKPGSDSQLALIAHTKRLPTLFLCL